MKGPYFRDALVGLETAVHLYSGAEGPGLVAHRDAALRYVQDKSDGEAGRARADATLDRCRAGLASMLGGRAKDVALLGNASEAISRLVAGLDLPAGSNVVTSDLEFPSGLHSVLALRDRGVEVRIARTSGGVLDVADVTRLIDSDTRLVLASHVSFSSGGRIDAAGVRDAAHAVGAAFVLDATQSLGVVPVEGAWADAIVASTYKWLLGPHGLGVLHVADPNRFARGLDAIGWRSIEDVFTVDRLERYDYRPGARRFELGFPSFLSAYLLSESLDLLATVNSRDLAEHVARMTTLLVDGLVSADFRVITPVDPERRAGNISVTSEEGGRVAARMLERGVRAWGGDGRVRFSVHGFTTSDEIDAAIASFTEVS